MKLADVSIKRPVFATMMIVALVIFGVIGYSRIGVDLFPNVEFPFIAVTAVYPGADPEAIETKVITKLEDAVAGISGIKTLRSMSMENVGQLLIQFVLERKVDEAAQDVRDKISAVLRDLPQEVEPPVVAKFDVGAAPIMSVVLSGRKPIRDLTTIAKDKVKTQLTKVLGVGGIDIVGGREREIQIWVRANQLEKNQLSVQDIFLALGAQNIEVPGGRFAEGNNELVVKTKGEVTSAEEISNLIIPIPTGGAPVRIGDVAQVVDSTQEARSYSSVNGTSAVSLTVRKQSGSNTTEVARAVKKEFAALAQDLQRQGINASILADTSGFIESSVGDVKFDLLFGGFLAVIIILFFLRSFRTTLISAIAIPTSVISTFAFIHLLGFTLNWLTLLALSLSIGILIDDAIVVIENIFRHIEEGEDRLTAAHKGTAEIGLAVMATTMSIVAVFIPVAFMKGMIGRFFYQFGITVSIAVLISLFVSFTLTPMLSSRFISGQIKGNFVARAIERLLNGIDNLYRGTLRWSLRHRAFVVSSAILILVVSLGLGKFLKIEFVPPMDRSELEVHVEMPTGKSLAATRRFVEALVSDIRSLPGVKDTFVTIGGGVQEKVNEAVIYVGLVKRHERNYPQASFMEFLRKKFKNRRGANISVTDVNMFGGSGMKNMPIQFNIRGNNLEKLNEVSQKMISELRKFPGFVDLDSSYRAGKPELNIQIDRERAAALGVPVASIATTIRALMGGDKATQIKESGSMYDVRVRLQAEDRLQPEDLGRLQVRSSLGKLVSLSNLIQVKKGSGPTQIDRQERQRQVTLLSGLSNKPLGEAISQVDQVAKKIVPADYTTSLTGMGEVLEESFSEMLFALFLAVVIVYMILAAQFESFVHPLTIMLSLPLSLIGAIGALLLTRYPMSIFAMIGIIMLMGLVTKNAILLVDYTNTLRRRGLSREEALLKAGPIRLRPILMTTAAMVFGMLPVALGLGEGGEIRSPMAICVIGGLITSTVLTLVVVPVVYTMLDNLVQKITGHEYGRTGQNEAVDDSPMKMQDHHAAQS